jgi:hypothetical protein
VTDVAVATTTEPLTHPVGISHPTAVVAQHLPYAPTCDHVAVVAQYSGVSVVEVVY